MAERHAMTKLHILFEIPDVDRVSVRRDVPYGVGAGDEVTMDIYYPPDARPDVPRPAVIVVEGYPDKGYEAFVGCKFKEVEACVSWAQLMAASGMVAITYTNREPAADPGHLAGVSRRACGVTWDRWGARRRLRELRKRPAGGVGPHGAGSRVPEVRRLLLRLHARPRRVDGHRRRGQNVPIRHAGSRQVGGQSAGARADLSGLRLDARGAPFEKRVWEALRAIPPGETTSYGAIAKALGAADASRAVGAANGANPIAIIVPCHRVIGSTGSLVGYGGGLDRKQWLLNHERRWRRDAQAGLFDMTGSSAIDRSA